MYKKCFLVKVELNIEKITCPGVWLCSNGKVSLQIHMLGSSTQTRTCKPIFPMLCHEKFVFSKTFYNETRLNELQRSLNNQWFYTELIQWKSCDEGCVLSTFRTTLDDLLYPSSFAGSITGMEMDLLMDPTPLFPGTISPKLQISTKTTIEETFYDADPINPNNTLVKPKSTLYKQPSQKGCARKVCHSIAFSRAQKNVPLRKTNSKPPFKYSKVSDDLILRSNPNIVLRDDTDHGDRITSEPSCYCMTKYPKNAWSETGDDNLSRSNEDLGNISTKGLIHSNKCSLCSLYEGYFPSKSSKMKSSCNSLLAHRTKPRLCAYCEQNYIRKQPRSRSGSPCRSDVTDSSRRRVCFCMSAERATSLSRQLHKKLSNALDTNSRLFQNCIDCED